MSKKIFKRLRAGIISAAVILSQLGMPVQTAFALNDNPKGPENNGRPGDIKVINPGTGDEIPNNVPQLDGCSVTVEFYNFDNTTAQPATVGFASQSPTASSAISVSGDSQAPVIPGDGDTDGNGNNDADGSYTYTLAFSGTPQDQQGYKVKLDVTVPGENGASKSKVFWMPKSCRTLTPVTPTEPTNTDKCGTLLDTYSIPTTEGVDYIVGEDVVTAGEYSTNGASSVTITAQALSGYTLTGTSTWTFDYDTLDCEVQQPVTPSGPTSSDVCGTENDTYTIPSKEGVDYLVDGKVISDGTYPTGGASSITITASAQDDYVLDGTSRWTFTFDTTPCHSNVCTVTNNLYDHVWNYGGNPYPEAGADPTGTPGSYAFHTDGLYLSTPATESYVDGWIDGGNTPLGDVDAMSYKTLRLAESAGYDATLPAYILLVDTNGSAAGGQKYFFYEPYNNNHDRAANEGVWQSWDALNSGAAKWWMSGTGQALHPWSYFVSEFPDAVVLAYGFNQGTYNAQTYTAIQDMTFDCATTHFNYSQGQGSTGGDTPTIPVTPVTPSTPVVTTQGKGALMPTELPETGAKGILNIWVTLLAALATYGAVYFLQPKKRFED